MAGDEVGRLAQRNNDGCILQGVDEVAVERVNLGVPNHGLSRGG